MTVRLGMSAKKAPTDAPDSRLDFRNGFVRNADNTLRTGITSPVGAAPVLVTATSTTSPMTVNVAALDAVASRDGGVVQLCNDGVIPVTIAAAPLSGSRLDVVYIMQHDSSSGVTTPDLDDLAGVYVAQGTSVPSGQPSKPAIPAAATEIGTVLMPAGVTSTSGGGVVITQTFQYTVAAGGIVPFPTQALMKLWTNPVLGQHASVLNDPTPSNNGDYVWSGTAWVGISDASPALFLARVAGTPAVTGGWTLMNSWATPELNTNFTFANGILTVLQSGIYDVAAAFATVINGVQSVQVTKNSATANVGTILSTQQSGFTCNAAVPAALVAGDQLRVFVAGPSATTVSGTNPSFLAVSYKSAR